MRREDSKMKELVSGYGETWSSQVSANQLTGCRYTVRVCLVGFFPEAPHLIIV